MARQRVRAETTWQSAKREHKKVQRELAAAACTGTVPNTQEHWKQVGRYNVLEEILWEQDK